MQAQSRQNEITEQQKELGYARFVENDTKAKKRLDTLSAEAITVAGEIVAIEAALVEAHKRLDAAKYHDNAEKDQAAARQQREVLAAFADCLKQIDDALKALVDSSVLSVELLRSMRRYGWAPDDRMWDVQLRMIIQTAIAQTPVKRDFPAIAPFERRTALGYLTGIGSNPGLLEIVGSRIAARLGETEEKAA